MLDATERLATDAERTLVAHLDVVERIARFIARRNGLAGADADDALSTVKLKLVENDYAILRKFRGESSLSTYLAVVIAGILRDYRIHRCGKWRPSAVARSLGAIAVRLETLTSRDGCSTSEAVERLVTSGEPGCTAIELRALAARLPHRDSLRPVEVSDDSPALEAHEVSQAEFVDPLAAMDRSLIEARLSEAV
jgi:hypothetical protein